MPGADTGSGVFCRLSLEFADSDEALRISSSVEMDNEGYLETAVEGNRIVAEIPASSLKSLLHTLDDFLSCISVAEKVGPKKH
jgi:tRNA threonylcarbamoyladenosine modification (KEOPS) complex  Pcc1 subunit